MSVGQRTAALAGWKECQHDRAQARLFMFRMSRELQLGAALSLTVTVSAGVAAGDPRSYDTVLALADTALYDSKRVGRNGVSVMGV